MVVSRARSSYRVRNRLDATFPKKGWEAGSFLTGLPRDVPRATHALCLSILLPKSVSLGTSFRTRTHTHTHTHLNKQTHIHTHVLHGRWFYRSVPRSSFNVVPLSIIVIAKTKPSIVIVRRRIVVPTLTASDHLAW